MTDIEEEDTWVDSDGNYIEYFNWDYAQPNNYAGADGNQNFAILLSSGKWDDSWGTTTGYALCIKEHSPHNFLLRAKHNANR